MDWYILIWGLIFLKKNMYIFLATSQSSSKAVSSPIGRHLMETESSNIFFFGVLNNNIYEKKELGWISLMKIIILKHSDLITKKRKIRWLYHAFEEICHMFNSICVYFHLSTFYWVHCMINFVLWIIEAGDLEKINFWDFITYREINQ